MKEGMIFLTINKLDNIIIKKITNNIVLLFGTEK